MKIDKIPPERQKEIDLYNQCMQEDSNIPEKYWDLRFKYIEERKQSVVFAIEHSLGINDCNREEIVWVNDPFDNFVHNKLKYFQDLLFQYAGRSYSILVGLQIGEVIVVPSYAVLKQKEMCSKYDFIPCIIFPYLSEEQKSSYRPKYKIQWDQLLINSSTGQVQNISKDKCITIMSGFEIAVLAAKYTYEQLNKNYSGTKRGALEIVSPENIFIRGFRGDSVRIIVNNQLEKSLEEICEKDIKEMNYGREIIITTQYIYATISPVESNILYRNGQYKIECSNIKNYRTNNNDLLSRWNKQNAQYTRFIPLSPLLLSPFKTVKEYLKSI